ncbi:hypothetical protein K6Y31_20690 [Motilimonas cestriensis]|uniref:DUF6950 domain-containing protein n=1 Tax=Motilimonas cestriensis TaxID=2742685 RepID=A0ABS8WG02_9GAMM|nr:hypothetical protein [Motilimonas cestriensis]MCE2597195.1 hypothetical protein [Motilimonas cestriensis]
MKLENWETALANVLLARKTAPFEWGENDCCLFAADCVQAQTGQDYAAAYRDRYTSGRGALRVLRNEGHASLADAVTAALGAPMKNPLFAQRGDVVLINTEADPAVGVVFAGACQFLSEHGLTQRPITDISAAWRIE